MRDTVFIIININQWSNVLRRTLEIDLVPHVNVCKCLSNVLFKNVTMSNENDNHDLAGASSPSTSGYSVNTWNSSTGTNKNTQSQHFLNGNKEAEMNENPPNLSPIHPIIPHSYPVLAHCIPANFYNLNPISNYYYTGDYYSYTFNMQYCQTREVHQMGNRNQRITKNEQKVTQLRKWENISNEKCNNKPGFIFTLMCYNILAQDLVVQHPHLYHRNSKESLKWNVRWNNIFKEITKFKPDVLCLQEVQESHIANYFSVLESLGYSSLYKRRTGERSDGCAFYYKTDVIQLVEHVTVEYYQPNIAVLNRDNVGLIAKFAPKLHPTREFVVATTHLLYNPRRHDVRLAQMQVLLTEIERISYTSKSESNYLPIILTGDLNSGPDSPIYEFISKGKLKYENLSPRSLKKSMDVITGKHFLSAELRITDNCQHADLLQKRIMNEKLPRLEETSVIQLFHSERQNRKKIEKGGLDEQLFSTGTLSHNFAFKSVYDHGSSENIEGTTFQGQWITVDYIFYSTKKGSNTEDKLKLLARYRLPTKDELRGVNIPNEELGSDHLSLLAKFKLEY